MAFSFYYSNTAGKAMSMTEGLKCPLCCEAYMTGGQCEPVMLRGCGHSICRLCLFNLIPNTCPSCGADYKGLYLELLPSNNGLFDLENTHNLTTTNCDVISVTRISSNPPLRSEPPMSAQLRSSAGPLQATDPPVSGQRRSSGVTFEPSAPPMSPNEFYHHNEDNLLSQTQSHPQQQSYNNNFIPNVEENKGVDEHESLMHDVSQCSAHLLEIKRSKICELM